MHKLPFLFAGAGDRSQAFIEESNIEEGNVQTLELSRPHHQSAPYPRVSKRNIQGPAFAFRSRIVRLNSLRVEGGMPGISAIPNLTKHQPTPHIHRKRPLFICHHLPASSVQHPVLNAGNRHALV